MNSYVGNWLRRKRKLYNPSGRCVECGQPVETHQKMCRECYDHAVQAENGIDYQDTLDCIRADWHR
jgi:predicted amidophosphoribosyltransferase